MRRLPRHPRALDVLKRHLALRARLVLAGKIRHNDLFFKDDGSPIRNLQYPWIRWKRTLRAMKARYREPYNARHSSVSWNLMIGKNPLWVWVAKQHGHSVQTMLEVYAAWTEGAKAADIEASKRAMDSDSRRHVVPNVVVQRLVPQIVQSGADPLQAPRFATTMPPRHPRPTASCRKVRECNGGREGFTSPHKYLNCCSFINSHNIGTNAGTNTSALWNPSLSAAQ